MDLTRKLAEFASALTFDDIPEPIVTRLKLSLLDGIGVMAGAVAFLEEKGDRTLSRLLELDGEPGPAALIGMGRTASPRTAALVNGTLSEVLDFSDCVLTVRNHPGAPVIPGLLAAAGTRPTGGRELLTAMAAGYEVFTRVCQAIQPSHWYRGFQCTGTIGACGAAVAAARLGGADADEMAAALGIAGFMMPVSNGDNVFRGHSVKPVHGGAAAMAGYAAAMLARAGFRSGPLEGEPPRHHGPLAIVADAVDAAPALQGLGEDWRIAELAYKPYPIGLLNIGAVELGAALSRNGAVDPDAITRISIRTYRDAVHFVTKYTTVESGFIDCYLSLPYCLAAALIDGDFWLDQLEDARLRDPKVHELAARIEVVEDEAMTRRYPHEWPIALVIERRDGPPVEAAVDAVAWSPRRPPVWEGIVGKFDRLTGTVYGSERGARIAALVRDIERQPDVGELLDLARG
jgi:2-methylcitrate dehydratase PrpD